MNTSPASPSDLPLVTMGAQSIDLVRRPPANETPTSPIFTQRHFGLASTRILLSDTAADITSLQTVTAAPPALLGDLALNPIAGYTMEATYPPLALSSGVAGDGYRSPAATCGASPNPNAVIRLQRVRDNPSTNQPRGAGNVDPFDCWPNVLYDTREGNLRDGIPMAQATMLLGGVMYFIELDVNNLRRWLQGAIGVSGPNVLDQNGFIVYFSDWRNNRDAANNETGKYGFEDFVNPASAAGTPNGVLDAGEDVNANSQLDTYGQFPIVPVGATAPLDAAARPTTLVTADEAQVNRAILYRRALKPVNGGLNNVPMPGLTVTSENPVYVQGDFNASAGAGGFVEPNAATAIIADGVTLLSNSWNNWDSLQSPHNRNNR